MVRIDIFSGFLGAGKTTLIKKLIKEAYRGEKVVLIENEFGEIGVDGGFMQDAGIEVTEMNSGCICCSLVGDFSRALKEVAAKFSPDRILIEPSGVGKLSDVIKAVQRAEVPESRLNAFCTVVDAKKCKMYLKNFGEFFLDQVENASCIVLSHTAGADEKVAEAVSLLREHTAATIVTTPWEQLAGADILQAMQRTDTLEAELNKLAAEAHAEHHHEKDEHHHHEGEEECHHVIITTRGKKSAVIITIMMMKKSVVIITTTRMKKSAIITIIITDITMRMKFSRAGGRKRRRNLPQTNSKPSSASWEAENSERYCARKASWTAAKAGSISITSPARRTSARAVRSSREDCA